MYRCILGPKQIVFKQIEIALEIESAVFPDYLRFVLLVNIGNVIPGQARCGMMYVVIVIVEE